MKQLTSQQELDSLLENGTAILYKHSAYCPISAAAYEEVEQFLETHQDAPVYLIDVNANRELSWYIADKTNITHHSPQAILLEGGEPKWHASHYEITAGVLEQQLGTSDG